MPLESYSLINFCLAAFSSSCCFASTAISFWNFCCISDANFSFSWNIFSYCAIVAEISLLFSTYFCNYLLKSAFSCLNRSNSCSCSATSAGPACSYAWPVSRSMICCFSKISDFNLALKASSAASLSCMANILACLPSSSLCNTSNYFYMGSVLDLINANSVLILYSFCFQSFNCLFVRFSSDSLSFNFKSSFWFMFSNSWYLTSIVRSFAWCSPDITFASILSFCNSFNLSISLVSVLYIYSTLIYKSSFWASLFCKLYFEWLNSRSSCLICSSRSIILELSCWTSSDFEEFIKAWACSNSFTLALALSNSFNSSFWSLSWSSSLEMASWCFDFRDASS